MIIPITWREKGTISNLEELLNSYHWKGGSIVEYQHMFSAVVYSSTYSVYEWVPAGKSRKIAGIKHALFCGFLGWWSFFGLMFAPVCIINNLLGGIDVTKVLTSPPPLPGQLPDMTAVAELNAARKRQGYIFVGYLFTVLLIVILLAWPYYKQLLFR